jgi:hypothetical protein
MDLRGLVLRDGDELAASGRLVRNQAGDWFEPLLPVAAVGGRRGGIRPVWRGAVRVCGADFGTLTGRIEEGGVVAGRAELTGIWSAGEIQVHRLGNPEPRHRGSPRWVVPPCPTPAGGWPRHEGPIPYFDLGDLRETGAAVGARVFRPGPDQAVLVVAAADPDAVEARLRPQLGERLCVVTSRWTAAELEAVRGHLAARHAAWHLLRLGSKTSDEGQGCINASPSRVLPEIASWGSSLPAGILSLDPWLRPTAPKPGQE